MEMMQAIPAAPPTPGPIPGKLPAAEDKELFRSLLLRQQVATAGKKMAEAGDATGLGAWLLPGLAQTVATAMPASAVADPALTAGTDPALTAVADPALAVVAIRPSRR